MSDFGFALLLIVVILLYAVDDGVFDRFSPHTQTEKIKELEEFRRLDSETIKDLQDRLEAAGLDNGIG